MKLEALSAHHEAPFLTMIQDFAKGDRATLLTLFNEPDWTAASFKRFAGQCEKDRLDWRPGPGKTSLSHYLLIEHGAACGYGRMRFPLSEDDDRLGNLEFFVPPSKRGQGYGALTLNRLLFEAVRAGMARALVVCEARNGPAQKCIEKNRGERTDSSAQSDHFRYWIRFR
jgi:predicted acetyltransferase